jgi:hypothetical protein
MQAPATLRGDYLKRLLQGIALGAVATMIIGFYWGGWTTSSTAQKMVSEAADKATVVALTPSCARMMASNTEAMAAFKKAEEGYRRESVVRDTVKEIDGKSPSSDLIDSCATTLTKSLKTTAQKT